MKNFFKNKKVLGLASAVVAASVIIPTAMQMGALSAASASDEGLPIPSTLDAASSINYATILNRAVDYGVISMDFHQKSHMESPIATYNFYNDSGDANEVDFMDSEHTAQFIIGNVVNGQIHLGGRQSPGNFNFELGNPGTYMGEDHPGVQYEDFKIDKMDSQSTPLDNYYYSFTDQENIYNNISNIVENMEEKSQYISKKIEDGYALDLPSYSNTTGKYHINLYYEEFKNRVVYIDVDDTLMNAISQSNGLIIEKYDSTVVVFNIGDKVTSNSYRGLDNFAKGGDTETGLLLGQFTVVAHDDETGDIFGSPLGNGYTGLTSASPSEAFKTDTKLSEATLDDLHINQKIVWNVTKEDVPVRMDASGGTILLAGGGPADLSTSSAGWVVTNGPFYLTQEWHYEYNGGSQDAPVDGKNEFHFALNKAFTEELSATPSEINSILTYEDDFKFCMYEYEGSFDPSTATLIADGDGNTEFGNAATSKVVFPSLRFDPNDPMFNDGPVVKHFRIFETNDETLVRDGYKIFANPDSYIDITLTVTKEDDGRLSFVVDHSTTFVDGAQSYS